MIYITGDTHGTIDISKLNSKNFPEGKFLTKNDYVIICGDFGFVWENKSEDMWWQKWLTNKPWTTIFCDGNHENHTLLNSYPVEKWNGGNVHKITNSIFHLMRGQIFNIDKMSFFVMGGAKSHDIHQRKENVSWWKEEIPSYSEFEEGFKNLEKNNWSVDFIISHTGPQDIINEITYYESEPTSKYLNAIKNNTTFKHWYFGHMHTDENILNKYSIMYDNIIKVGEANEN